jgi:hypothetical protein
VTVPGLVRLSELEERLERAETLLGVLARFADPTSPQLSREDRDSIVAYARQTREPIHPGPPGGSTSEPQP